MPIYEYQCETCGRVLEALQRFSDEPLSTCEHCSGKLNKLISQSSFHLKGSGWYVTDYAKRTSSGKSSPDKATESKSSTNSASTGKTSDSSKTSSGD